MMMDNFWFLAIAGVIVWAILDNGDIIGAVAGAVIFVWLATRLM
jgi:hypothetical protein